MAAGIGFPFFIKKNRREIRIAQLRERERHMLERNVCTREGEKFSMGFLEKPYDDI